MNQVAADNELLQKHTFRQGKALMAKYLAAVHTHAVVGTCQTFPFSFKHQLNYTCAVEAITIPQCVCSAAHIGSGGIQTFVSLEI